MVTRYSEDAPPVPLRVKVYSRIAPLVSNPTYCRTTASLTKPTIPKGKQSQVQTQEPLKQIERFRKSNKRGTSMMAHLCVSVSSRVLHQRSIFGAKMERVPEALQFSVIIK